MQKTFNFKPVRRGSEVFQRYTVPETETFVSKEQNCIQGHFLKKLGSGAVFSQKWVPLGRVFPDGLCFALY